VTSRIQIRSSTGLAVSIAKNIAVLEAFGVGGFWLAITAAMDVGVEPGGIACSPGSWDNVPIRLSGFRDFRATNKQECIHAEYQCGS